MSNSLLSTPWIAYSQPNFQAKLRLFCFPYAGGSATIFRTWSHDLPKTVEVCPIELPGRGSRLMETPFTQMGPLIDSVSRVLLPYLDKPFALFGHSMGALISFELARYLRQICGKSPLHLFVSGRHAPHIPDRSPMHALPESEFLQKLSRLNGTPKTVLENPEMMKLFIPMLRADLALDELYVYASEPALDIPITVFGGLQDPETTYEELEAWRSHTSNSFSLQLFPGDHFFINTKQKLLLQAVKTSICLTN